MGKTKKNLAGYALVIVFALFLSLPFFNIVVGLIEGDQRHQTLSVKLCLIGFMEQNKSFPSSEAELIKKGFLIKETQNNVTVYYVNTTTEKYRTRGFQPVPDFEKIKLAYGIGTSSLARKGRVIYNKKKGYERMLIVEGPWRSQKKIYKDATYELYKELLEQLGMTG